MDIFMGLSIMQLEFGLVLFMAGFVAKKFSKQDNKRIFSNKIKNQGLFNMILGIISGIIQYLNQNLLLISIIIFVVGIIFSITYLTINFIVLVKNSSMNIVIKITAIIGAILISIFMFFGDYIADKFAIGFRKFDESITVGKEFLLYECNNTSHGNEKVYMTINKIEKDNGSCVDNDDLTCTVMYFDLRYEGDKPINLIDESRSFSDLCSFTTSLSCNKLKDDDWSDDFIIEDDINSPAIHTEYANELPKVIKPGTTLKNLTHPIAIMGVRYDDIPVKDINIEIETRFKMQHEGANIRENINK